MKFSVVVPTRNGGPLLERCLRSALDQGYDDLEVCVSDNANTDETPEVLERLGSDPRLRSSRTEEPLRQAANWQRALELSSGDYVVLLQDDELLLPDYFERMAAYLKTLDDPDCLSCNGYYFIAADAAGTGTAYYREPAYPDEAPPGSPLDRGTRRRLAARAFRKLSFEFGVPAMVRTLVSRRAIERLPNDLFRPEFADETAQLALLATAERWHIVPDRLVVVGVAEKSFWRQHFAGDRLEAARYLGIDTVDASLPGDHALSAVYVTAEKLKAEHPKAFSALHPNRGLYVARQVFLWLRQWRSKTIDGVELRRRLRLVKLGDWPRAVLPSGREALRRV